MSGSNSLFDGFLVMVAGIVLSVMLMATLGQIGDQFLSIMIDDIGVTAFNPDWASGFNMVYTMQSILFISCILPGIFGVVVFILAAVRRQRYTTFTGTEEPQIDYTQQYQEFR